MALQSITNVNVDFYDKKYILISAKQLDKNSRFLSVTCYNHGEPYGIYYTQHSAYIRYKKADGYGVLNLCEINNDGKIIVELTEQMLAADGICYADLIIVNKSDAVVNYSDTGVILGLDSSSILSTMTFCIDVSETAIQNSEIESSYEYNGLNEALQRAETEYREVIQWAKSYAMGDAGGVRPNEDEDNSKYYYELAAQSASNASGSESAAAESASNAATSESNAAESASNAATSEFNAAESASAADGSASSAKTYAENAEKSASAADGFAITANESMKSAIGSASSASESAKNAQSYYIQTEAITNGLNGAFSPKGTITFAELIELKESGAVVAGYLYHISDDFTTDENFRISGKECGAGTSVYYTVDGKFDCFVGTTVAGVKGGSETEYRTGMVNITTENIGAIPTTDIATVDEIKNYLGI